MEEPTPPDNATGLFIDWMYGAQDFPRGTKPCPECEGSGCSNCHKGLIYPDNAQNSE